MGSGGITVVQSVDSTSDSSVEYAITIGGDLLRKAGVATAMIAQYIASVEYIQGDAISPSTAKYHGSCRFYRDIEDLQRWIANFRCNLL